MSDRHERSAIARLVAERDMAREEARQLREEMRGMARAFEVNEAAYVHHSMTPEAWNLSKAERAMFLALVNHKTASIIELMTALHFVGGKGEHPKILNVHVCNMRKKLEPFGVKIENIWGVGYRLLDRHKYQRGGADGAAA